MRRNHIENTSRKADCFAETKSLKKPVRLMALILTAAAAR